MGETEEQSVVQEGATIWRVKEGSDKCFSNHVVTETFLSSLLQVHCNIKTFFITSPPSLYMSLLHTE
jgi:hypothetical protein